MLTERLPTNPIIELPKDKDWGYGQLLAVLMRRRFWFFGGFIGVLLASILLTLRAKPIYQSSMRVLVQPNYKSQPKTNGINTPQMEFSDPGVQVDLTTQLQVLKSSELLQQAINRLKADYPDLKVEDFIRSLEVGPVYTTSGSQKVPTNLLQVNYIDDDSIKTKAVVQTLLRIYQTYNLEQQKIRLSKGLEFIDGQLPLVRRSVFEAEAALEQFRRSNNIIDPSEQAKTAAAQLTNIQREREALKASIQEAAAAYSSLQQQLALSPKGAIASSRLSQSPLYQTRLNELQKLDLNLEALRQKLTDDHPQVQDLLRQRQVQARSLQQEANDVLGSNTVATNPQQLISNGQLGGNDLSLAQQLTTVQNNLSSLQAKDKSLGQTEEELSKDLKRYPVLIAQYERLQPAVQLQRNTLQRLLDAKQDLSLDIARGGYNWEVVEAPKKGKQISPNLRQNILLGAVLGLFLGAIAAFIRESMDDRVRTQTDLEQQIPLPILGIVPEISHPLNHSALLSLQSSHVPTHTNTTPAIFQWGPLREAFDLIYANIQLLKTSKPLKSLAITSPQSGEGKSTISIGLAISAARLDKRVLLIDADLRQPILHEVFSISNHEGLSTILVGEASEQEVLSVPQWVQMRWDDESNAILDDIQQEFNSAGFMPPSDLSIDILTSGPITADPVKLLNPLRLKRIIQTFQSKYDLILVDCPPTLGLVDVIQVGMGCDGVALVARLDKVTRSDLAEGIEALNRFNVIGIIANSVNASDRSYRRSSYLRSS